MLRRPAWWMQYLFGNLLQFSSLLAYYSTDFWFNRLFSSRELFVGVAFWGQEVNITSLHKAYTHASILSRYDSVGKQCDRMTPILNVKF